MYDILIVLAVLFSNVAGKIDWCSKELDCEPGNTGPDYRGYKVFKTTMCAYDGNNKNCINPIELLQDEDDKKLLLDHHNAYRYLYASRYLNQTTTDCKIGYLKWDKELENKAKAWAHECPFVKKFCPPDESIEQSVDIMHDDLPPTSNLSVFFKNWFRPFETMPDQEEESIIRSWQPGAWNKATLALWAKTERVGCSFVTFHSGDARLIYQFCQVRKMNQHFKVLICNYSPAGNVEGQEVMKTTCDHEPQPPKPDPHAPVVVPGVDIDDVILPEVPVAPDSGDDFINISDIDVPPDITTNMPNITTLLPSTTMESESPTGVTIITLTPATNQTVVPTRVNPASSSPPLYSFVNLPYIIIPPLVFMRKYTRFCLFVFSVQVLFYIAVWLDLISNIIGPMINVGNVAEA
uniref:Venom allergen 5 n=1 Tax=Lygus hesperus TaxID=30085 RepID=A0A0A9YN31_LYGHE